MLIRNKKHWGPWLLAAGMGCITAALLLARLTPLPDFVRGLLQGTGIGLLLVSIMVQVKQRGPLRKLR